MLVPTLGRSMTKMRESLIIFYTSPEALFTFHLSRKYGVCGREVDLKFMIHFSFHDNFLFSLLTLTLKK